MINYIFYYLAKKNSLRIFLFSLLFLFLSGSSEAKPNTSTLLLIGDSHAYGMAPVLKAIAAPQTVRLESYAIGGSNTRQWMTRGWLDYAVKKYNPKLILIILGTNDYGVIWARSCQKYKEKEKKDKCGKDIYLKRANKIVEYLKERNITSVWILPPKMRVATKIIDEAIKESNPDYIFNTKELNLPLEKDRVHVTYKGKKIWSKAIWEFLENI